MTQWQKNIPWESKLLLWSLPGDCSSFPLNWPDSGVWPCPTIQLLSRSPLCTLNEERGENKRRTWGIWQGRGMGWLLYCGILATPLWLTALRDGAWEGGGGDLFRELSERNLQKNIHALHEIIRKKYKQPMSPQLLILKNPKKRSRCFSLCAIFFEESCLWNKKTKTRKLKRFNSF